MTNIHVRHPLWALCEREPETARETAAVANVAKNRALSRRRLGIRRQFTYCKWARVTRGYDGKSMIYFCMHKLYNIFPLVAICAMLIANRTQNSILTASILLVPALFTTNAASFRLSISSRAVSFLSLSPLLSSFTVFAHFDIPTIFDVDYRSLEHVRTSAFVWISHFTMMTTMATATTTFAQNFKISLIVCSHNGFTVVRVHFHPTHPRFISFHSIPNHSEPFRSGSLTPTSSPHQTRC